MKRAEALRHVHAYMKARWRKCPESEAIKAFQNAVGRERYQTYTRKIQFASVIIDEHKDCALTCQTELLKFFDIED